MGQRSPLVTLAATAVGSSPCSWSTAPRPAARPDRGRDPDVGTDHRRRRPRTRRPQQQPQPLEQTSATPTQTTLTATYVGKTTES